MVLLGGKGKSKVLLLCPAHGPKGASEALVSSLRWHWAQQGKTWSSEIYLQMRKCNLPYLNLLWLYGVIITPLVSFFLWDKSGHPSSWVSGTFDLFAVLVFCLSLLSETKRQQNRGFFLPHCSLPYPYGKCIEQLLKWCFFLSILQHKEIWVSSA